MQDNLIQLTKLELGLTAGILLERWEKVKPYYIDEIIPFKKKGKNIYTEYKIIFSKHGKKVVEYDHNALQTAINRAYKSNSRPSK